MNPMAMLKIKALLDKFKENHPKFPLFLNAASMSIDEGSIIEISITTSNGRNLCTNMKITSEDIEMVRQLKEMGSK